MIACAYGNAWRSPVPGAAFINEGPHPHWRFRVADIDDLRTKTQQAGWHPNVIALARMADAESELITRHPDRSWQVILVGEPLA